MPKVTMTIVGTGGVASVVLANGSSYTLNANTVLTAGSIYEFEIHVPKGFEGVTVTGATLLWTTSAPLEEG